MSEKQMSISDIATRLDADEVNAELATLSPEKPRTLVKKLCEIMGAIGWIEKGGTNTHFNYKYATEADLVSKIRGELVRRNVFIFPSTSHHARTQKLESKMTITDIMVTWTFVDGDSGETWECNIPGSGEDSGDKGVYKALTGSEKYLLMKAFLIPTGDDPERDDSNGDRGSKEDAHAVADRKLAEFQAKEAAQMAHIDSQTAAKATTASAGATLGVGFVEKVEILLTAKKQAYMKVTQNGITMSLFDNAMMETVDGPLPLFNLLANRTEKNIHGMLPNTFCHFIVEKSKQYYNIKGIRQIGDYCWDESGMSIRKL